MYIIAGLGNPTREYEKTRHNVGFEAVDILADKLGARVTEKKHRAFCGTGRIGPEKVILSKPQTFMNLSGESIRAMADFYKVEPDHIIIICDDINLAEGQLRIRTKGSAGGHNGLKNIINHLGTRNFQGSGWEWEKNQRKWIWRTMFWAVSPGSRKGLWTRPIRMRQRLPS